jgi:hypothetical protein
MSRQERDAIHDGIHVKRTENHFPRQSSQLDIGSPLIGSLLIGSLIVEDEKGAKPPAHKGLG